MKRGLLPRSEEGRGGTSRTPSPTKEGQSVGRDALIPPPIETVSAERSGDRSLREAMPSVMGGTSRTPSPTKDVDIDLHSLFVGRFPLTLQKPGVILNLYENRRKQSCIFGPDV
jgi:hypothetical protein